MSISSDITRIKGAKDDMKTAINAKGGSLTTELIDEYPAAVDAIPTGTDTSSATATASDILMGKTAYISDGTEATGTCDFNADTTDATAVENSLLYGHTAYGAAGTKLMGAGAWWQEVTTPVGLFKNSSFSGEVSLYLPKATSINEIFYGCKNITHQTVTISSQCTKMVNSFYQAPIGTDRYLQRVTIFGTTQSVTDFGQMCYGTPLLETIDGDPINASSATTFYNAFAGSDVLTYIRFVANTIKANISFSSSPLLSSASLVSIANGLNAASAPKTLTMHATSKTNMDNIMVDNNAGVAVLGSAMTLTQFINNVKGWTIA